MTVKCAMHKGQVYLNKDQLMEYITSEQAAGVPADIVLKNLLANFAKIRSSTIDWSRD